jgi:hypothetical protein
MLTSVAGTVASFAGAGAFLLATWALERRREEIEYWLAVGSVIGGWGGVGVLLADVVRS